MRTWPSPKPWKTRPPAPTSPCWTRRAAARKWRACWAAWKSTAKRGRTRRRCWKKPGIGNRESGVVEARMLPLFRFTIPDSRFFLLRPHVQHQRVIDDFEAVLRGDFVLQPLDFLVDE